MFICFDTQSTADLYCHILSQIEKECEPQEEKGVVRKVCQEKYRFVANFRILVHLIK